MNILKSWLKEKTGCNLTWQSMRDYKLKMLNETIIRAQTQSLFYRRLYSNFLGQEKLSRSENGFVFLNSLEELKLLPAIGIDTLVNHGRELLCADQSEIARIVTLTTSGTAGEPKRLYFSRADLDATVAFFRYGLLNLMPPQGKALVLFGCKSPDGVGDLLLQALGDRARPGPVSGSYREAAEILHSQDARFLIGHAVTILGIGRYAAANNLPLPRLSGMLVSGDYAAPAILTGLNNIFGCPVYEHYGLTEAGYGGAVACRENSGLHLRGADIELEIISPKSGLPVREGEKGEIVLTTLTRTAMPLIRYKTGDEGQWLPGRCRCGLPLTRISPEIKRLGELSVPGGLTLGRLDDALFKLPAVVNISCRYNKLNGEIILRVTAVSPLSEENIRDTLLESGIPQPIQIEIIAADSLPGFHKRGIEC